MASSGMAASRGNNFFGGRTLLAYNLNTVDFEYVCCMFDHIGNIGAWYSKLTEVVVRGRVNDG
jgi:hypothetical protein